MDSFLNFFCDGDGSREFQLGGSREFLLTYGIAEVCANHSDVDVRARLQTTYEHHLRSVRLYFSKTADRAARLLRLDLTANDAGRALCEFAYGSGATRCALLTSIPDVQVEELMLNMAQQTLHGGDEACDAVTEAVCEVPGCGASCKRQCRLDITMQSMKLDGVPNSTSCKKVV